MKGKIFTFELNVIKEQLDNKTLNLLSDENSFDVTLVSDDQIPFPAHKSVLSACSSTFKSLLLSNPNSHPLIYLRGVMQKELTQVLQFLYFGKATTSKGRIGILRNVAQDLNIEHLKDAIELDCGDGLDIHKNNQQEDAEENVIQREQCDPQNKTDVSVATLAQCKQKVQGFYCAECNITFKTSSGLRKHKESRHDGIRYTCPICKHQFTGRSQLRKHTETIHEGIRYSCNFCDHVVTRRSILNKHLKVYHGGLRHNFVNEYLENQDQFEKDGEIDNKSTRPLSCFVCGAEFSCSENLYVHIETTHQLYSCKQCDYRTLKLSNLNEHQGMAH